MKKVICLDTGAEYIISSISGYDAIQKMLYTLNLKHRDDNAQLSLCNGRTWSLVHNGQTYAAIL